VFAHKKLFRLVYCNALASWDRSGVNNVPVLKKQCELSSYFNPSLIFARRAPGVVFTTLNFFVTYEWAH
jgi:hypothetical protein